MVTNLKVSLPITTTEDNDDFSELGPSLSEGIDLGSALEKDKPKDKGISCPPSYSEPEKAPITSPGEDPFLRWFNSCITPKLYKSRPGSHFILEGQNGALRNKSMAGKQEVFTHSNENNKTHSDIISNHYIPLNISQHEQREAISVYGEIIRSFLKPSKSMGLDAKMINLKNFCLPINGLSGGIGYIPIWKSNNSVEAIEAAIQSRCRPHMHVFGLARTKEFAAHVLFRLEDISGLLGIDKLSIVLSAKRLLSTKPWGKRKDSEVPTKGHSKKKLVISCDGSYRPLTMTIGGGLVVRSGDYGFLQAVSFRFKPPAVDATHTEFIALKVAIEYVVNNFEFQSILIFIDNPAVYEALTSHCKNKEHNQILRDDIVKRLASKDARIALMPGKYLPLAHGLSQDGSSDKLEGGWEKNQVFQIVDIFNIHQIQRDVRQIDRFHNDRIQIEDLKLTEVGRQFGVDDVLKS